MFRNINPSVFKILTSKLYTHLYSLDVKINDLTPKLYIHLFIYSLGVKINSVYVTDNVLALLVHEDINSLTLLCSANALYWCVWN
ncbi:hypothetical protein LDVICp005 [lymphocystis disease virus-China]|uniref:Uncharacterized protein n=1 Tax=lymphocystis disease virus-China TaxID=256729 RepID=Q678K4_9VIRU|nr:hypothetical protein LDVICp005 [lymphocystis disease virus-China]AAU10853.1 hypothetical protein [lymphocystis disease virus-China]